MTAVAEGCGHTARDWCYECERLEAEHQALADARQRALRPGADYATNGSPGSRSYKDVEILHATGCQYVIHPDTITLEDYVHGVRGSEFMTRAEATAWLAAARSRRRCRACCPSIPDVIWPHKPRRWPRSGLGWPADQWHQPPSHRKNNTCV